MVSGMETVFIIAVVGLVVAAISYIGIAVWADSREAREIEEDLDRIFGPEWEDED